MKPDLIVSQPRSVDYPIWRFTIQKCRRDFDQVLVVVHEDHRDLDNREWIRTHFPEGELLEADPTLPGQDWRNNCIQPALRKSRSEWVLFMEQDFLPEDDLFFKRVFAKTEDKDVIGFADGNHWSINVRLHPAFLLLRRELIEKTDKNFSAVWPWDHFGLFCNELLELSPRFMSLQDLGETKWKHLQGLTSNFCLIASGHPPNFKPHEIADYAQRSLACNTPIHPEFEKILTKAITYGETSSGGIPPA